MNIQGKLSIFLFVVFFHSFVQLACMEVKEGKESKSLVKTLTRDEMQTLIQEASKIERLDEKELIEIAETNGYGYKTANLTKLQELVKKLDRFKEMTRYTIQVPEFVGISSTEIQSFIKFNLEFDLDNKWNKLVEPYKKKLNSMIKKNNFPKGFLDKLNSRIARPIEQAFDDAIKDIDDDTTLGDIFDIKDIDTQATMTTLLSQTKVVLQELIKKAKNKRFMVRSTGKEDTKKLANAGGNESVANVAPTLKALLEAMKIVVVSYFGEKSMKQRLGAGDLTLFDAPFTPVLVQLMIGEKQGGYELFGITRCGVMFTEEPEGSISKNTDEKETKFASSGITVIQAAYGHNEGVVNSRIPVDTFYIDDTGSIDPVIREKTTRLVPDKDHVGRLTMRSNPRILKNVPALSSQTILMLKLLAQALEAYYQGPMDVEYVIDVVQEIIYVVQARPIVHNPNQPQPSYLADLDDEKLISDKVFGRSIGVAGGALQLITNEKEVIFAPTINAALNKYQDEKTDRKIVKAIIIGQMAPATSHEATTFRSELKPVLQCNEFERIAEWLQDSHANLVVDMQQQVVVKLKDEIQSLNELGSNKRDGWISYPLPLLTSMTLDPYLKEEKFTEDSIQKLLNIDVKSFAKILESTKKIEAGARSFDDLREFIKTLKTTDDADEFKITLGKIAVFWMKLLKPYEKIINGDEILKKQSLLLTQHFFSCTQHVQKMVDYKPGSKLYTKRLYAIRFLEALLLQNPKPIDALDGYSYLTLLKAVQQAKKSLKAVGGDKMVAAFNLVGNRAITPELSKKWQDFVMKLSEKDYSRLQSLLLNLKKVEALDLWLHTSFVNTYDKEIKKSIDSKSAEKIIKSLVAEVKGVENFLNDLALHKKRIDQLHTDSWLNAWEEPKNFESHMSDLEEELDFFKDEKAFIQAFRDAPEIGKIIALSLMDDFVEVFDLSIKWLSRSNKYSDINQKIERFRIMLDKNGSVIQKWVTLLPSSSRNLLFSLDWVNNFSSKSFQEGEQFKSSQNFNVSLFALGSPVRALEDRYKPITLEDYFTFFHQSLINIVGMLIKKNTSLDKVKIPDWVIKIKNSLINDLKVKLVSLKFKKGFLSFKFNFPLRAHNAILKLTYNRKKEMVSLSSEFFGDNDFRRWQYISKYISVVSKIINLKVLSEESEKSVKFTWIITQDDVVISNKTCNLYKYIRCAADITFTFFEESFFRTYLSLNSKQQQEYLREVIDLNCNLIKVGGRWQEALRFLLADILRAIKNLPNEMNNVPYFIKAAESSNLNNIILNNPSWNEEELVSIIKLIISHIAVIIYTRAERNSSLDYALKESDLFGKLKEIANPVKLLQLGEMSKTLKEAIEKGKTLQEKLKKMYEQGTLSKENRKQIAWDTKNYIPQINQVFESIKTNNFFIFFPSNQEKWYKEFFDAMKKRINDFVNQKNQINFAYLDWMAATVKDTVKIFKQIQELLNAATDKVHKEETKEGNES